MTLLLRELRGQVETLTQQLRAAGRLEAMGRLTVEVAHDFNNLMTVILGSAEDVRSQLSSTSAANEPVQRIVAVAKAASQLAAQLLSLTPSRSYVPVSVDVNEIAEATLGLLSRLFETQIEVALVRCEGPAWVRVDPANLSHAILNLALNARDAMPHGGLLTLETAVEAEGVERRVVFSLTDSGVGMEPETLAQIFEPFFTTKALGHGAGVGLASVRAFIERAKGRLAVESQPGEGTTFRLEFRAAEPAEDGAILVVDDTDVVRDVLEAMLAEAGYRVVTASCGDEALRIDGAIQLALLDVVIPGMRSDELAERLRRRRGDLPVIYMSGRAANGAVKQEVERGATLLRKPIEFDALIGAVREHLAQGV